MAMANPKSKSGNGKAKVQAKAQSGGGNGKAKAKTKAPLLASLRPRDARARNRRPDTMAKQLEHAKDRLSKEAYACDVGARRSGPLNHQHQMFVNAYLREFDGVEACLEAYPKTSNRKVASSKACRLLAKPHIRDALREAIGKINFDALVTIEELVQADRNLAFSDVRKIFDQDDWTLLAPKDLPDDIADAISAIQVRHTVNEDGSRSSEFKYSFWDKNKARDRLYKYVGLSIGEGGLGGVHTHNHLHLSLSRLSDDQLAVAAQIAQLNHLSEGDICPALPSP